MTFAFLYLFIILLSLLLLERNTNIIDIQIRIRNGIFFTSFTYSNFAFPSIAKTKNVKIKAEEKQYRLN